MTPTRSGTATVSAQATVTATPTGTLTPAAALVPAWLVAATGDSTYTVASNGYDYAFTPWSAVQQNDGNGNLVALAGGALAGLLIVTNAGCASGVAYTSALFTGGDVASACATPAPACR